MAKITISVNDSERMHNIVGIELVEEHTLKVLSKVRDTDQNTNVIVKFEKPTNRCTASNWISESQHKQNIQIHFTFHHHFLSIIFITNRAAMITSITALFSKIFQGFKS